MLRAGRGVRRSEPAHHGLPTTTKTAIRSCATHSRGHVPFGPRPAEPDLRRWRPGCGVADPGPSPYGSPAGRTCSRRLSRPLFPQSTRTGQLPACVADPTIHLHVIFEPVFRPSPWASEMVVSWTTWIVQRALGDTTTVSEAWPLGLTVAVNDILWTAAAAGCALSAISRAARRAARKVTEIVSHRRASRLTHRPPGSRPHRPDHVRGEGIATTSAAGRGGPSPRTTALHPARSARQPRSGRPRSSAASRPELAGAEFA